MGSPEFLFLRIVRTDLTAFHQSQSGFPALALVPAALCTTDSLLQWAVPPHVPSLILRAALCTVSSLLLHIQEELLSFKSVLLSLVVRMEWQRPTFWRGEPETRSLFHFCSFAAYKRFSRLFFSSLNTLNISSQSLLACKPSAKKSTESLKGVSLHINHFSSVALKIPSLLLTFDISIAIYLSVDFFRDILLGDFLSSWRGHQFPSVSLESFQPVCIESAFCFFNWNTINI